MINLEKLLGTKATVSLDEIGLEGVYEAVIVAIDDSEDSEGLDILVAVKSEDFPIRVNQMAKKYDENNTWVTKSIENPAQFDDTHGFVWISSEDDVYKFNI